jgi:hypothetical protein
MVLELHNNSTFGPYVESVARKEPLGLPTNQRALRLRELALVPASARLPTL